MAPAAKTHALSLLASLALFLFSGWMIGGRLGLGIALLVLSTFGVVAYLVAYMVGYDE